MKTIELVKRAASKVTTPLSIEGQRLAIVKDERSLMLPVEALAIAEADIEIASLERKKRMAEFSRKIGVQVLSEEIFSWINKVGLPAFAPFMINGAGECCLSEKKLNVPESCKKFYNHVPSLIKRRKRINYWKIYFAGLIAVLLTIAFFSQDRLMMFTVSLLSAVIACGCFTAEFMDREYELRTSISGVIPRHVRDRIGEIGGNFQEVFILAEAKWSVKKVLTPIPPGDPLVIGYNGDAYWLISVFDTTSLEKLVSDEFCQRVEL
jgi:hypothetical protein